MNQYSDLEEQYTKRPPLNLSHADVISPTCYDAMWTFAYALNHTLAGMAKQVHVESKTGCFLCMYIYMYIHADMHVECMPTWIPYANAAYPLTSPRGSKVKINVKLVRRKRESLGTRLAFFYITILYPCSSDFETNTTLSKLANNFIENETLHTHPFRIENFSYKNNIVMNTLFRHMENTNFRGVTVRRGVYLQNTGSVSLA